LIPISADDRRLTSDNEAGDEDMVEGGEEEMAEGGEEVVDASSDWLLQCSCRRTQCWHGASALHYSLIQYDSP